MAVLHWFFMHDKYFAIKMPLHYIDWMSIVLFVSTFMFSAYVYAFGKQQDWWNSRKIIHASVVAFVSFGMLCVRQLTLKRPYLSFNIFKKSNELYKQNICVSNQNFTLETLRIYA